MGTKLIVYPFFGFGFYFFRTRRFFEAFCSFGKAVDILVEMSLEEAEETALLVNNMGCCLFEAGKSEQAYEYLRVAEINLQEYQGAKSEKSTCIQNNIRRFLAHNIKFSLPSTTTFKFYHREILKRKTLKLKTKN